MCIRSFQRRSMARRWSSTRTREWSISTTPSSLAWSPTLKKPKRKRSVAFGRAGSARYGKPPTTSTRPARPNGRRSVPNRHCFGGRRSGRPRSSFTNRRRGNTCASAWKGRPPNKPTRKCTKRSTTDLWKRKRGRSSSNTVSAQWSVGVYARSSDPSFLLHPTLFPTSLHPDPNPDADELKWKIWILTGIFFIAASIGSFQLPTGYGMLGFLFGLLCTMLLAFYGYRKGIVRLHRMTPEEMEDAVEIRTGDLVIKMENKIADDERKRKEREEQDEEETRARKAMLKAKRKEYERSVKRERKRLEAAKRKEANKDAEMEKAAAKTNQEDMAGLQKAIGGAGVLAAFGASGSAKAGALPPLGETKEGDEETKQGGEAAGLNSLALGESSVNDIPQTSTLPAPSNKTATVVPATPADALAPVKPPAKVSTWVADPRTPKKDGLGPVKLAAKKVVPSAAQEIIDIANRKNSELEQDTVHVVDIGSADAATGFNGPAEDVTKTISPDTPGAFTEDDGGSVDHASIGGTASVSTYSTALTGVTIGTSVTHSHVVRLQPVAGDAGSGGGGSSRSGREGGRAGVNSNQLEDLERGEQEEHDDLEEEAIT
mmetsp:Transcript_64396/g.178369  ORF Transcript_64396/g.178369 Transcript_64396/m.178369 type:complete len:601 (-) Transcript_64396:134-1936(-)